MYDPVEQRGYHPCMDQKQGCQHLCLPKSEKTFSCQCATGYMIHPENSKACIGINDFLIYSISWEIHGISTNGSNASAVLGPISRVSMASAVGFLYEDDLIFWADSDHGTITSIGRDGTKRKMVRILII